MNLNDYFLVKAFSRPEYMVSFNSGNIYLNSTSYFWKLENTFQQDKEGEVFHQTGKGFIIKARPGFEKIVMSSSSVEQIINRASEENFGKVICETAEVTFRLEGYICCFYLLPKSDVSFTQSTISITSEKARRDIAYFLEKYLNESTTKDFNVSIYDAVTFCSIFFEEMKKKGYRLTAGAVEYKNNNEIQKIKQFQNKDFRSILFTKPTQFSYQKEFRIFINNANEQVKENILVGGVEVYKSLLGSFNYDNIRKKD